VAWEGQAADARELRFRSSARRRARVLGDVAKGCDSSMRDRIAAITILLVVFLAPGIAAALLSAILQSETAALLVLLAVLLNVKGRSNGAR